MTGSLKKILTFLLFISAGCEEINDIEIEIPHKEFTVVQAELKNGHVFRGVSITKTLPLGEAFDIKEAEIKDAEAYLLINGVQVIPIHYTQNGIYKPLNDLLITAGNTYELFADAGGKEIYSKTKVPRRPEPDNIVFEQDYVSASVFPKPDEVYGAAWIIQTSAASVISKAEDFYSITQPLSGLIDAEINIRTQDITAKYNNENFRSFTYIKVYSFDKPYYEFFKSRNNSRPIDNSITQGGGAVAWNVYGENVIGLFIGVSEGDLLKAN